MVIYTKTNNTCLLGIYVAYFLSSLSWIQSQFWHMNSAVWTVHIAVTPVKAAPPLCLIAITSHFLFFLSRFSSYPKPKKSSWPERGRLINTSVSKKTESCWIVHTCRTVNTFIEGGHSVLDECKLEKMLSSENVPFIFVCTGAPKIM